MHKPKTLQAWLNKMVRRRKKVASNAVLLNPILQNIFLCFYPDINECNTRSHFCEQRCINTDGSYHCSCKPGFILAPDRRYCKGMVGLILFLDKNSFRVSLHACASVARTKKSGVRWLSYSPSLKFLTARHPTLELHTKQLHDQVQAALHRCHRVSFGVPLSTRTLFDTVWLRFGLYVVSGRHFLMCT